MSTFVIAEIGSAWRFGDNNLGNAIRAVLAAKWAGADAVKFQWTSNPRLMEQRRSMPDGSYDILDWPEEWIPAIKQQCDAIGIEFMCTVFVPEDVPKLDKFVTRWKVASLESADEELIFAMRHKEIIVSYGARGSGECMASSRNLHCTAAYPAPLDQLNLMVISKGYDGYSDHSCDVLTGAVAVACGAKIIEVHFKLNETPPACTDYGHSHFPDMLHHYIDNIRKAEIMLGDGKKKVEACEQWALKHKVKA